MTCEVWPTTGCGGREWLSAHTHARTHTHTHTHQGFIRTGFFKGGKLDSMYFSICIVFFGFLLVVLLRFIWQWFSECKK